MTNRTLVKTALAYAIAGLVMGVVFRELTKIAGVIDNTALASTHVHLLVLGMLFYLVMLALNNQYHLTQDKKFKGFYWTYNISLILVVVMLVVRGCTQVFGVDLTSAQDAMISGLAGLTHIGLAAGIIRYFVILLRCVPTTKN